MMGLFSKITEGWQVARGGVLRQEVEGYLKYSMKLGPEEALEFCKGVYNSYLTFEAKYTSLSILSKQGKKDAALVFNKIGEKFIDTNVPKAHAFFLVSAYIEAHALPGEHAARAEMISRIMINKARYTIQTMLNEKPDFQPPIEEGMEMAMQETENFLDDKL